MDLGCEQLCRIVELRRRCGRLHWTWFAAPARALLFSAVAGLLSVAFGAGPKNGLKADDGNAGRSQPLTLLESKSDPSVDLASFTAGLRYDCFETFGDTLNLRLSPILRPQESTVLKFLVGSSNCGPDATELYNSDGGFSAKPSPVLDPEAIDTYRAVWEPYTQKLIKNVRFSAGLYNLFNRQYDVPGDSEHVQVLIPQGGRSFRFKLT